MSEKEPTFTSGWTQDGTSSAVSAINTEGNNPEDSDDIDSEEGYSHLLPLIGRISITPERSELITQHIENYQSAIRDTYETLIEGRELPGAPDHVVDDPDLWRSRQLTEREHEILYLAATGAGNKEIARTLSISDQTVKNHLSGILKKMRATDRLDAIHQGVDDGLIDPLLIDVDSDFGEITELTDKERQLYDALCAKGNHSNRDLAQKLSVADQTVKNHITSIMRKLGMRNRVEIKLFEEKRQEKILRADLDSLDLTEQELFYLTLLTFNPNNVRTYATDVQGVSLLIPFISESEQLYKKMAIANTAECAALGLFYGVADKDSFAPPAVQAACRNLTPEQRGILNKLAMFRNSTTLETRAGLLGRNTSDLKRELAKFLSEAGINNLFQAMVMVKYEDFKDRQRDLLRRQSYFEDLDSSTSAPLANFDEEVNDDFGVFTERDF